MTDRKAYHREYMRNKRAKQKEATTPGQHPTVSTVPNPLDNFTHSQLEKLSEIVKNELQALLTQAPVNTSTLVDKSTVNKRVNPVDTRRTCPFCGGNVTGSINKVYCSHRCSKAAFRCRRSELRSQTSDLSALKRFDEFWAAYPSGYRSNRGDAEGAWAKKGYDAIADEIIRDVEMRNANGLIWITDTHVPLPATYLNAKPWA